MLLDDIKTNFKQFNSITKYPSIPTYHEITGKSTLQSNLTPEVDKIIATKTGKLQITEKVDGTNLRVILVKSNGKRNLFLGSRDDIVYSTFEGFDVSKDSIGAYRFMESDVNLTEKFMKEDGIYVLYMEMYGGRIGAGCKNYSNHPDKVSFRLFDSWFMPEKDVIKVLGMEPVKVSSWREKQHGQPYDNEKTRDKICAVTNIKSVPSVSSINIGDMPVKLETVYKWLVKFSKTQCALTDVAFKKSEGVVVRTDDRSLIFKIRFEDYEKTLGLRGANAKILRRLAKEKPEMAEFYLELAELI